MSTQSNARASARQAPAAQSGDDPGSKPLANTYQLIPEGDKLPSNGDCPQPGCGGRLQPSYLGGALTYICNNPRCGFERPAHPEDDDDGAGVPDLRPRIVVAPGKLAAMTESAAVVLGGLAKSDPLGGIYRRDLLLARPVRIGADEDKSGIRRTVGSLAIVTADVEHLRLRLAQLANFTKRDTRARRMVPADCPRDVPESLVAAADMFACLPRLAGIVEAPALRPDGSVLDRPGYDPATGLLFDPGRTRFAPIPERPTMQQAVAALTKLLKVYEAFPFTDDAARSVAVAAVLSALTRKAVRGAPLFLFSAPKMASGKSLLATIAGYIATGRAPAMLAQANDPESERKRLLSILMAGPPVVCIDNVERALRGDALCSILTEPLFQDRVLGVSKMATVPTDLTFLATGNSLRVEGDLSSRALLCELDPECERPEEREFAVNLHEFVPANRGELAAAALTVVRAYLAAGAPKPAGLRNFARFEDWSRFAREPLVWLGLPDPCLTREKLIIDDPVSRDLGNLLRAWHEAFGTSPQTIAGAVTASSTNEPLREALEAMAGDGRGGINGKAVGRWIGAHEKRIEGGLRFERHAVNAQGGLVRWKAVAF